MTNIYAVREKTTFINQGFVDKSYRSVRDLEHILKKCVKTTLVAALYGLSLQRQEKESFRQFDRKTTQ
jgi:hypothetical protein